MADYSKVVTVATTSTSAGTLPLKGGTGWVRIENLDTANPIWISLKTGVAAVVEADDMIRILAGQSRRVPILKDIQVIAVTAPVKVLFDSSISSTQ